MAGKDEDYTSDVYVVVSRPASNKKYRIGVLLSSKGTVVRTCGHTHTHTSSKAATDCMRDGLKGTSFNIS